MTVKVVTKISKKGQTHVPVEIQKFLNLEFGDKLLWEEKDGIIYITKWA